MNDSGNSASREHAAQAAAPTETPGARSDRSVIVYLSFLGVLLATGIDIALPAFDAIEADFGADVSSCSVRSLCRCWAI